MVLSHRSIILNGKLLRFVWFDAILVITALLLNVYHLTTVDGKLSSGGSKKKVVIVGEMSDLLANESSRNEDTTDWNSDYEYDDYNHNRMRRGNHMQSVGPYVRRKTPGSVFVPVAAYSVTKSKTKPSRTSSNGYRKRKGSPMRRNPSLPSSGKQTESAVYGYMQRPEIIEFRGQYFYGPRPGDSLDTSGSTATGVSHPVWEEGGMEALPTHAQPSYSGLTANKLKTTGGLGPGGLLLATLPLILAPMLSYLFTPMIIPITATVAAGRRRRDTGEDSPLVMRVSTMEPVVQKQLNDASFDTKSTSNTHRADEWQAFDRLDDPRIKEAQVVAQYLQKVQFDERATTRAVANYLQCDGMLADSDHCIELLSCEFSDPNNTDAPSLDRAVTSIILSHILANEYITESFKIKLKYAAVYGRNNTGKCANKYECSKVA